MTPPVEPVRLLAPAKLTLSLRITGTRPDGYHLIDAEMVTLDLCDELLLWPARESSVEILTLYDLQPQPAEAATTNAPPADASALSEPLRQSLRAVSAPYAMHAKPHRRTDGLPGERSAAPAPDVMPTDRSNLVIGALELAGRTAHVEIRKRIPPGAGLGGGSADAAAVLRWANQLTASEFARYDAAHGAPPGTAGGQPQEPAGPSASTGSPGVVTSQQAAALGADVAFCLVGGRARVTGIGEMVEPLPFRDQAFVLWTPPIHVDTARVYRTWDELGGPTGDQPNDLESAALVAYPELAEWRDQLAAETGQTPQLAGSGGTWFVPAPSGTDAVLLTRGVTSAIRARTLGYP